jgi:IclR family transcriptional regulator, KDG regulon repressor
MPRKREKSKYIIQSVAHALAVIEELSRADGEVGVTELSKRVGLHKNNIFRILATLELNGLVTQNKQTESYSLGVKCLEYGQAYLAKSDLVNRSWPIIKELSVALRETVSLAVLRGTVVQFPLTVESPRTVKVGSRFAVSLEAKNSAVGWLLTSHLPDSELETLLNGNTPQDVAIKGKLAEMRAQGYLIDRGARDPEVLSICHVIRGVDERIVGAIEVQIPQYRAKTEDCLSEVKRAAEEISRSLGSLGRSSTENRIEKTVVASKGSSAANNVVLENQATVGATKQGMSRI